MSARRGHRVTMNMRKGREGLATQNINNHSKDSTFYSVLSKMIYNSITRSLFLFVENQLWRARAKRRIRI